MYRKRRSGIQRLASSAAIALPVTVALLFLMTRLILPGEHDRIVTRMIRNIELQRTVRPLQTADTRVSEPARVREADPAPTRPDSSVENSTPVQRQAMRPEDRSDEEEPVRPVDWWSEARRLTRESSAEALEQWSLEQGDERYVSIMQGPLPITNAVRARSLPNQEDATGYLNIYGDMEYKISENCIATTQVVVAIDDSDFVRALPMVITCVRPPKPKISFERYDRE